MEGWRGCRFASLALLACLGLLHLTGTVEGNAQRLFLEKKLKHYDVNVWPDFNTDRRYMNLSVFDVPEGAPNSSYQPYGTGPSHRAKRSLPEGIQWSLEPLEATQVLVQMFINSFGSLNAANMDYSIDVFLRQHWNDPRLKFNGTRTRFTVTDPVIQGKIWKPDTYFNNVKDAEVHKVTMPNILLRIYNTGDVLYSMRVTLTLSCSMEFEHYPFDAQVCGTSISSYANTDDVIQYGWVKKKPIDLPDDLEVAQFDLINYRTETLTQYFVTGNFTGLKVHFNLRRQNGYHVLQTYIPTILIVVISWVSFWLDPNAVPGRISLGVTTLLTLTTLASGIRAQLPPVSYVKAIDVWIGMCMIMVFGALLEFTFVNWLANKKMISERMAMLKIPKALAGSDAEEVGKDHVEKKMEAEKENQQAAADAEDPGSKTRKTYINFARAFDRLCRAFFPGVFLIFNLIYWPYYLIKQEAALEK